MISNFVQSFIFSQLFSLIVYLRYRRELIILEILLNTQKSHNISFNIIINRVTKTETS